MPEYAAVSDYEAMFGPPAPEGVATALPYAADLVAGAIINDLYQVGETGLPAKPSLLDAVRRATLMQTKYWIDNGINPAAGVAGITPTAVSSSIGSASITKEAAGMAARDAEQRASLKALVGPARNILRLNGLGSAAVGLW